MAIGVVARTCRPLGSSNVLIADDSGKSFWGIAVSNFAGQNKKDWPKRNPTAEIAAADFGSRIYRPK
jgi:hypothetical protein